jgi:hypothetical protein
MLNVILALLRSLLSGIPPQALALENLMLRNQLGVLSRLARHSMQTTSTSFPFFRFLLVRPKKSFCSPGSRVEWSHGWVFAAISIIILYLLH